MCLRKGYRADKENILNVHSSGCETIEECVDHNISIIQSEYAPSQVEFYETDIGFFCIAYSPYTGANDLYLFYVYPSQRYRKCEQLDLAIELSDLTLVACIPHDNVKCNRFFSRTCIKKITSDCAMIYILSKKDN